MATALCPCRGLGTGPDQPTTRFQRGCRAEDEAVTAGVDAMAVAARTDSRFTLAGQ